MPAVGDWVMVQGPACRGWHGLVMETDQGYARVRLEYDFAGPIKPRDMVFPFRELVPPTRPRLVWVEIVQAREPGRWCW